MTIAANSGSSNFFFLPPSSFKIFFFFSIFSATLKYDCKFGKMVRFARGSNLQNFPGCSFLVFLSAAALRGT